MPRRPGAASARPTSGRLMATRGCFATQITKLRNYGSFLFLPCRLGLARNKKRGISTPPARLSSGFRPKPGGTTHRGSHQKESTARQPSCTIKPLLLAPGSTLERCSTRKIPPKLQNAAHGVVLMCARAAGWAAAAARRPPATRHSLEATPKNKKSAAGCRHECGTVAAVVVQAERVMPEAKSSVSHRVRARSTDLTSRTQHKPDRPVRRGGWEAPTRAPAAPFLSSVVFSSV